MNSFFSEQLNANTHSPQLVFTDFQPFNRSVTPGNELLPNPIHQTQELTLPHDQSVFTIEFAALDYQIVEHNLYQYKLEGFDQDWSPPSDKRSATYTNLNPGTYQFMVKGSNNDAVWNDMPVKLTIHILPPWYQTLWFRIIATMAGIGIIFIGYQVRVNTIGKQKRVLENSVQERTIALSKEVQQRQQIEEKLREVNIQLQDQVDEITLLRDHLHELAIRDELTGLFNRRYLKETLRLFLAHAKRDSHPISAMLIDIDHFKTINDTYGHSAGDEALAAIAQKLSSLTREEDITCRYGGEEFVIISPHLDLEDALLRAEQIRTEIAGLDLMCKQQKTNITISIGISSYPGQAFDEDDLLNKADNAMYEAKRLGRNQVVAYSNSIRQDR